MNEPAPTPAPAERSVLDLLFVTLTVALETLGPAAEAGVIVDYARELQDAITSYWRRVYDNIEEEDELPF